MTDKFSYLNIAAENPCKEPLDETRQCNTNKCPKWTEWSDWTTCSASCDGGSKSRVRECTLVRSGLEASACGGGNLNETVTCNTNPCPTWTPWTEWSQCSATCGGGTQHRARECVIPKYNKNGNLF